MIQAHSKSKEVKYRLELQNRFRKSEGKEDLNIENVNQETGESILGFKNRKKEGFDKKIHGINFKRRKQPTVKLIVLCLIE